MNRFEYFQVRDTCKKKSELKGKSDSPDYMVFFEKFDNDTCFKIVWKRVGTGGECEVYSIVKISIEEYDNIV